MDQVLRVPQERLDSELPEEMVHQDHLDLRVLLDHQVLLEDLAGMDLLEHQAQPQAQLDQLVLKAPTEVPASPELKELQDQLDFRVSLDYLDQRV